ncbi:MAG: hypothetical protein VX185_13800 [Pseudomonadota bacterium]|nr:hypothetical protein [Pseudomonadota bacterium]
MANSIPSKGPFTPSPEQSSHSKQQSSSEQRRSPYQENMNAPSRRASMASVRTASSTPSPAIEQEQLTIVSINLLIRGRRVAQTTVPNSWLNNPGNRPFREILIESKAVNGNTDNRCWMRAAWANILLGTTNITSTLQNTAIYEAGELQDQDINQIQNVCDAYRNSRNLSAIVTPEGRLQHEEAFERITIPLLRSKINTIPNQPLALANLKSRLRANLQEITQYGMGSEDMVALLHVIFAMPFKQVSHAPDNGYLLSLSLTNSAQQDAFQLGNIRAQQLQPYLNTPVLKLTRNHYTLLLPQLPARHPTQQINTPPARPETPEPKQPIAKAQEDEDQYNKKNSFSAISEQGHGYFKQLETARQKHLIYLSGTGHGWARATWFSILLSKTPETLKTNLTNCFGHLKVLDNEIEELYQYAVGLNSSRFPASYLEVEIQRSQSLLRTNDTQNGRSLTPGIDSHIVKNSRNSWNFTASGPERFLFPKAIEEATQKIGMFILLHSINCQLAEENISNDDRNLLINLRQKLANKGDHLEHSEIHWPIQFLQGFFALPTMLIEKNKNPDLTHALFNHHLRITNDGESMDVNRVQTETQHQHLIFISNHNLNTNRERMDFHLGLTLQPHHDSQVIQPLVEPENQIIADSPIDRLPPQGLYVPEYIPNPQDYLDDYEKQLVSAGAVEAIDELKLIKPMAPELSPSMFNINKFYINKETMPKILIGISSGFKYDNKFYEPQTFLVIAEKGRLTRAFGVIHHNHTPGKITKATPAGRFYSPILFDNGTPVPMLKNNRSAGFNSESNAEMYFKANYTEKDKSNNTTTKKNEHLQFFNLPLQPEEISELVSLINNEVQILFNTDQQVINNAGRIGDQRYMAASMYKAGLSNAQLKAIKNAPSGNDYDIIDKLIELATQKTNPQRLPDFSQMVSTIYTFRMSQRLSFNSDSKVNQLLNDKSAMTLELMKLYNVWAEGFDESNISNILHSPMILLSHLMKEDFWQLVLVGKNGGSNVVSSTTLLDRRNSEGKTLENKLDEFIQEIKPYFMQMKQNNIMLSTFSELSDDLAHLWQPVAELKPTLSIYPEGHEPKVEHVQGRKLIDYRQFEQQSITASPTNQITLPRTDGIVKALANIQNNLASLRYHVLVEHIPTYVQARSEINQIVKAMSKHVEQNRPGVKEARKEFGGVDLAVDQPAKYSSTSKQDLKMQSLKNLANNAQNMQSIGQTGVSDTYARHLSENRNIFREEHALYKLNTAGLDEYDQQNRIIPNIWANSLVKGILTVLDPNNLVVINKDEQTQAQKSLIQHLANDEHLNAFHTTLLSRFKIKGILKPRSFQFHMTMHEQDMYARFEEILDAFERYASLIAQSTAHFAQRTNSADTLQAIERALQNVGNALEVQNAHKDTANLAQGYRATLGITFLDNTEYLKIFKETDGLEALRLKWSHLDWDLLDWNDTMEHNLKVIKQDVVKKLDVPDDIAPILYRYIEQALNLRVEGHSQEPAQEFEMRNGKSVQTKGMLTLATTNLPNRKGKNEGRVQWSEITKLGKQPIENDDLKDKNLAYQRTMRDGLDKMQNSRARLEKANAKKNQQTEEQRIYEAQLDAIEAIAIPERPKGTLRITNNTTAE